MTRQPNWVDDRGESLVELMVTIVLMSTAVIALIGGIATSVRVSDIHRKQATSGVYVRAFAEALEQSMAASPSGYILCATTSSYEPVYQVPPPARHQAKVTAVQYWDGTKFVADCPSGGDVGAQRVTLRVHSLDDRGAEQLTIILRRPCRSALEFPLDLRCT